MPNQLNFGKPIESMVNERPYRLSTSDQILTQTAEKTNIFGTHPNDNIEIWFYRPDGSYASSIRLSAQDPDITLSTIIDNTGALESTNLNLEKIISRANLGPGRYSVSFYFFRDEIGSQTSKRMYIREISTSRTEVKLTSLDGSDNTAQTELYEFIVPSVPRLYAKGLVDQIFGKSLDTQPGEYITPLNVAMRMPNNTMDKINQTNTWQQFQSMTDYVITETYNRTVQRLQDESVNYNVQSAELADYITAALDEVLAEITSRMMVDPRFNLV